MYLKYFYAALFSHSEGVSRRLRFSAVLSRSTWTRAEFSAQRVRSQFSALRPPPRRLSLLRPTCRRQPSQATEGRSPRLLGGRAEARLGLRSPLHSLSAGPAWKARQIPTAASPWRGPGPKPDSAGRDCGLTPGDWGREARIEKPPPSIAAARFPAAQAPRGAAAADWSVARAPVNRHPAYGRCPQERRLPALRR